MKKLLIDDNRSKAEALISKIETLYISRVNTLAIRIKNLGIEDLTKDLLLEAIGGNLQSVNNQYQDLYKQDLEVFKMPEMRNQVEATFTSKFRDVQNAAEDFQSKELRDFLPFSLQVLSGIFELDEKCRAYIPEEKKAVIIEGFKEYIENPELLRVYSLHIETAKKVEELVNAIRKNGIDRLNSMCTVGGYSVLCLFQIGDDPETGAFSVRPRRIVYKAESAGEEDQD